MGKIVSVYEHFGLRTTFRKKLSSWTEVWLYWYIYNHRYMAHVSMIVDIPIYCCVRLLHLVPTSIFIFHNVFNLSWTPIIDRLLVKSFLIFFDYNMSLHIITSVFHSLCYLSQLHYCCFLTTITNLVLRSSSFNSTFKHLKLVSLFFTFFNFVLPGLFYIPKHNLIQVLEYLFLPLTLLLVREKIQHWTSNNKDDTVTVARDWGRSSDSFCIDSCFHHSGNVRGLEI